MASMASQLTEEVTAHAQSDSLEEAREICADGTYFPNNLRIFCWLLKTTGMSSPENYKHQCSFIYWYWLLFDSC